MGIFLQALPPCFSTKNTVAIKGLCMIDEQFLRTIPRYGIGGFVGKIFKNVKKHPEFVAGDTRVLENPTLSSFHTMFARLHNIVTVTK